MVRTSDVLADVPISKFIAWVKAQPTDRPITNGRRSKTCPVASFLKEDFSAPDPSVGCTDYGPSDAFNAARFSLPNDYTTAVDLADCGGSTYKEYVELLDRRFPNA